CQPAPPPLPARSSTPRGRSLTRPGPASTVPARSARPPPMPIPGQPSPTLTRPPSAHASATATTVRDGFEPAAGVLACVFPGLGHWVLGERWRAMAIAAGVLGLFFGGMLIGGIDVVDSREDTIWFVGEALVGPVAFGVDY